MIKHWKNKSPSQFYEKAVGFLGKPTFVADVPHGMAYWRTKGLYREHLLRDEYIAHCVPAPHHDYFYSTIVFYVPPDKLKDVLSISGSIAYDGLKKELRARCASMEANIATLYLGMMIASGTMKIQEVKKKGLYSSHIRGEAKEYQEMEREMRQMKKENQKKFKKELKDPFYRLAFSSCPS